MNNHTLQEENKEAPQHSKQALAHIRVIHMVLGFMQVRLVLRGWKYRQQYVPNQRPIASDTISWFPRPHASNYNTVSCQASALTSQIKIQFPGFYRLKRKQ